LNNYKTDIINEDNLEELIKLKENRNNICNYKKSSKDLKNIENWWKY